MAPEVLSVSERKILNKNGTISTGLSISYRVGVHGPFTLLTTQQDIASGVAAQAMQNFANQLATLPQST